MQTLTASPLARTVSETPTDVWNDSCAVDELEYAVGFGAVGATANPTIVVDVWKKDPAPLGVARARARRRAARLVGARAGVGDRGRDERPRRAAPDARLRGVRRTRRQAIGPDRSDAVPRRAGHGHPGLRLHRLAPNIIVKFPTTVAGLAAMEEASYRGISVNATVSFSVAQALAAAEAVQRGIERREAEGEDTSRMGPVITIMMGRLEDWLRVVVDRDGLVVDPSALPWSGVAVFKRAYGEWQHRGFRARLLGAAIRHHLHWSELIGGDVVITMPSAWQKRFNASSVEVRARIEDPGALRRRAARASPTSCAPTSPTACRRTTSIRGDRPSRRCARSSARTTTCCTSSARRCSRRDRPAPVARVGEPVTPERAGWRLPVVLRPAPVHGAEPSSAAGLRDRDRHPRRRRRAGGRPRAARACIGLGRAAVGGVSAAGSPATIEPSGQLVTVAVANAPASGRATAEAPVRIGPEDVRVEIRGAGNATRQINHIITPDFPADRLEVVEVYTPSGNWSSWPPHKHDTDDMPNEAVLEEVYSYAFRRPEAWGIQRLYGGSIDALWRCATARP